MKFSMQTLIITTILSTHALSGMQSEKKHIMIPLEGFLFRVNTSAALNEMGVSGSMSAAWTGGLSGLWKSASFKGPDQTALATRLFALLANVEESCEGSAFTPPQSGPDVYWRGIKAPAVIINWLKSAKPCSKIKELVLPHIQNNAGRLERTSLETLANIVFDPVKNASMLLPNEEALALVAELKEKGHTIHVVDNWNKEAFEQLSTQHPETLKAINGMVHISGQTQSLKSATHCALHDTFFKAHPEVPVAGSLFIETEQEHIKPLNAKNFEHIMCASSDIKKLRDAAQITALLK